MVNNERKDLLGNFYDNLKEKKIWSLTSLDDTSQRIDARSFEKYSSSVSLRTYQRVAQKSRSFRKGYDDDGLRGSSYGER